LEGEIFHRDPESSVCEVLEVHQTDQTDLTDARKQKQLLEQLPEPRSAIQQQACPAMTSLAVVFC
jgi:hypothetical protein